MPRAPGPAPHPAPGAPRRARPAHLAGRAERAAGAAAGAVAAVGALAVGELVAGLAGSAPSLVVALADIAVDITPLRLVRAAVVTVGTADKPLLLAGVTLAVLVLGAALGHAARFARRRAVLGWAVFGALACWAALRTPSAGGAAAVSALGAAALGCGLLLALLAVAPRPADEPGAGGPGALDPPAVAFESPLDPAATRRGFFAWTGAAAAGAAVAGGVGRRLSGATSKVEEARAQVTLPPLPAPEPPAGRLDDVAGISPYLTPNGEFYRIDTALVTPRVDPSSWRLKVRGLVERPFALSFDELLALPSISQAVTIACVSNEVGGELVGNAVWQGVPLAELLDRAGVGADATQVVGRSVDGWTGGFPTEIALDGRPAMVAYAMNGEPLPVRNGFPARLIVPGLYGYVSATKWLTEIELTRLDRFDGYWIPRGWSKLGPIKLQSRIDTPRADDVRRAGPVAVAGVAWAPTRGISGVEVRIGDGAWLPARLGPALSDLTWVQWVFDWDAAPGQHRITVRAIDGDGSIQTADRAPVVPNGATGLHAIWVTVE